MCICLRQVDESYGCTFEGYNLVYFVRIPWCTFRLRQDDFLRCKKNTCSLVFLMLNWSAQKIERRIQTCEGSYPDWCNLRDSILCWGFLLGLVTICTNSVLGCWAATNLSLVISLRDCPFSLSHLSMIITLSVTLGLTDHQCDIGTSVFVFSILSMTFVFNNTSSWYRATSLP